jgi:hypothetical protein
LQVLFVLVNLGVAEALREGPKTAAQLAAAAGPNTNAEWLARVLKLAAELGLVGWLVQLLQLHGHWGMRVPKAAHTT